MGYFSRMPRKITVDAALSAGMDDYMWRPANINRRNRKHRDFGPTLIDNKPYPETTLNDNEPALDKLRTLKLTGMLQALTD